MNRTDSRPKDDLRLDRGVKIGELAPLPCAIKASGDVAKWASATHFRDPAPLTDANKGLATVARLNKGTHAISNRCQISNEPHPLNKERSMITGHVRRIARVC